MPAGGIASITTLIGSKPNEDCASPADGALEYVVLSVGDNGVGMTETMRQSVFEPFFTTKGIGHGNGLGLSMVQGIVEQSGGFIRVSSQPGKGTTFRVYLPLVSANYSTGEVPAESSPHGRETVLVVEDEPGVREFAAVALRAYGYHAVVAQNAAHALALIEQGESVDLVLTDVVMPDMNGPELVRRLVALRPGIKALYMSGYTADVMVHHGVEDEDAALIQKPFRAEHLSAKVREVLQTRPAGPATESGPAES